MSIECSFSWHILHLKIIYNKFKEIVRYKWEWNIDQWSSIWFPITLVDLALWITRKKPIKPTWTEKWVFPLRYTFTEKQSTSTKSKITQLKNHMGLFTQLYVHLYSVHSARNSISFNVHSKTKTMFVHWIEHSPLKLQKSYCLTNIETTHRWPYFLLFFLCVVLRN